MQVKIVFFFLLIFKLYLSSEYWLVAKLNQVQAGRQRQIVENDTLLCVSDGVHETSVVFRRLHQCFIRSDQFLVNGHQIGSWRRHSSGIQMPIDRAARCHPRRSYGMSSLACRILLKSLRIYCLAYKLEIFHLPCLPPSISGPHSQSIFRPFLPLYWSSQLVVLQERSTLQNYGAHENVSFVLLISSSARLIGQEFARLSPFQLPLALNTFTIVQY